MNAVAQFNAAFGRTFREPLECEHLALMMDIARLRGRPDIAEALEREHAQRVEMSDAPRCESVEEHNAFPQGRW